MPLQQQQPSSFAVFSQQAIFFSTAGAGEAVGCDAGVG
jgi:hypothetical protein